MKAKIKTVEAKLEVVSSIPQEKQIKLKSAINQILAGAKIDKVLSNYCLKENELIEYIAQQYPTDLEKFTFLENEMFVNSIRALNTFKRSANTMSASDAAKAATLFAGKALEIKKAKEQGFKEAAPSVSLILRLETTLSKLLPA